MKIVDEDDMRSDYSDYESTISGSELSSPKSSPNNSPKSINMKSCPVLPPIEIESSRAGSRENVKSPKEEPKKLRVWKYVEARTPT